MFRNKHDNSNFYFIAAISIIAFSIIAIAMLGFILLTFLISFAIAIK